MKSGSAPRGKPAPRGTGLWYTLASRDATMAHRRGCQVCSSPLPHGGRTYCSASCAREARNRRRRRPRRTIECARCHRRFRQTRRGNRFCSHACRQAQWRREPVVARELRQVLTRDLGGRAHRATPIRYEPSLGCLACGGPTLTMAGTRRYLVGCKDCLPKRAAQILSCPHTKKSFPSRQRRPRRSVCLRCGAGIVDVKVAARIFSLPA
jgi:hypothetical protein